MKRRFALGVGAVVVLAVIGWVLFHPELRPDPQTVSALLRAELAKTGFKATQGVASAEFKVHNSVDGLDEEGTSWQKLAAIDALLTEKSSRRHWKGGTEQMTGLYVGPLQVVGFNREWPPIIGDLLPYILWSSTRMAEFAVEERHEFPNAAGGRLLARVTYEDRYADGGLMQTERRRLRCEVEKVVDAVSIHAALGGKAALIHCQEALEQDGRRRGPENLGAYTFEHVRYAHWYVLDRGWSIPQEGEIGIDFNNAPHVRKWRSKLLSFEPR